jgi:UPF0755 protein
MYRRRRTQQMGKAARISMLLVFMGLVIMVVVVYKMYSRVFVSNVNLASEHVIFYIPTGTGYEEVVKNLEKENIIEDRRSFNWVARKKLYDANVKPGRYKIKNGLSNNELINMLRAGNQDPVMVVFHHIRTLNELAGRVSSYLEADSLTFLDYLTGDALPAQYGLTKETFTSMFIPNTYEFFWTTTPEEFTERMNREYELFWKGKRDKQAVDMGMTRAQVVTLASIVDEETLFDDENPKVAGVYINRLKQGIPLQADPTLKYAMGDFTLKRILNVDKNIDSPYNTYRYKGLPPGPISIPSVSAIDGVLNYEKHRYIYFCARADFSGYHAFATTLAKHNSNAREYQQALNRNRIYR